MVRRSFHILEFRDGSREVPAHLAALMTGMETFRFTYREALSQVNDKLFGNWLNGKQDSILRRHFKENR